MTMALISEPAFRYRPTVLERKQDIERTRLFREKKKKELLEKEQIKNYKSTLPKSEKKRIRAMAKEQYTATLTQSDKDRIRTQAKQLILGKIENPFGEP